MKMKLLLVAVLAVSVLFAGVVPVRAEDALPLPDYTKAPYGKLKEKDDVLKAFPELGVLHLVLYTTTERPAVGESSVLIGSMPDSGAPLYAEWLTVISSSEFSVRVYLRKENTWVFVIEATGQQTLPKQEEQKEDK